jgi:hypothetical protein
MWQADSNSESRANHPLLVPPAKTLGKDAKLTPITNIASLTSQVKKTG